MIYAIINKIRNAYYEIKWRKSDITHHWHRIDDLLHEYRKEKVDDEDFIKQARYELKETSDYHELEDEREDLELWSYQAKKDIIKKKHEESLNNIEAIKYQTKKEIEELEKKQRMIAWALENDKREFLMKLNTYENRVFKKESLSKKEFQVLIEDGFKQVNEYCVFEKKRIPVLVKPFGNHTISHEFLVWSVKRLIKKTDGIKKIKEHLTRDADLTFEFKGKEFALEIEKGELLRKHKQLKEKIDYLDKEYPERWMIVVSNRDFLTKYKKFGFTSTRERLSENLQKMLKNAHTKIPYV